MKIAIPLGSDMELYRDNPLTAPQYGIYHLHKTQQGDLKVLLSDVIKNRLCDLVGCTLDDAKKKCSCDAVQQEDFAHQLEHYALPDAIVGCDYLLANFSCENTKKVLARSGIKLFHYASFIRQTDQAIKNFIIGVSFADTIQHINYAS